MSATKCISNCPHIEKKGAAKKAMGMKSTLVIPVACYSIGKERQQQYSCYLELGLIHLCIVDTAKQKQKQPTKL